MIRLVYHNPRAVPPPRRTNQIVVSRNSKHGVAPNLQQPAGQVLPHGPRVIDAGVQVAGGAASHGAGAGGGRWRHGVGREGWWRVEGVCECVGLVGAAHAAQQREQHAGLTQSAGGGRERGGHAAIG